MNQFNLLVYLCTLLLIASSSSLAQKRICNNFENGLSNWRYHNTPTGSAGPQPTTSCSVLNSPGSSSTTSMYVTDRSGSTVIYNDVDFTGDFSDYYGECMCFDINLEVNSTALKPYIIFYKDFDPTQKIEWGVNPRYAVRFTSSHNLPVNRTWKTICVSFDECVGDWLPNNNHGSWLIMGGGGCDTWYEVMSDVEGVLFSVDMSGWPGPEKFRLDNICLTPCPSDVVVQDPPTGSGNCCAELRGEIKRINKELAAIRKKLGIKPVLIKPGVRKR